MEKDKTDKKDHILDVAERVFSELGFDGASTRMISGEACVNMAMLNYYFGSKEGLFLAIFKRKMISFQDQLNNLGNDDSKNAWEKIEKYIELYTKRVVSNNCFQKLLYQELSMQRRGELSDQITDIMMKNVGEVRKLLMEGINNGEFKKDTDIEMVIATIYGTKNFLVGSPQLTNKVMGYDIQDEKVVDEQLKPRVENYLKTLLKAYLLNEHDNLPK